MKFRNASQRLTCVAEFWHNGRAMDKYFERRLELAANPRMRKRHGKKPRKFVRAKSHVEAVVRDMLAEGGGDGRIFDPNPVKMSDNIAGSVFAPAMAVRDLAIAAAMDGVEAVKKRMGKKERMKKLAKRRKYYAADAERRERQREAIREATPKVACRCPKPAALEEAYRRRRESEEWQLRFGTLMIDLEEHARREYAITGNKFVGSSGGVKDWLKENCPILAAHYSTCQRYKRLAQDYST